jgi:hypothetical protein
MLPEPAPEKLPEPAPEPYRETPELPSSTNGPTARSSVWTSPSAAGDGGAETNASVQSSERRRRASRMCTPQFERLALTLVTTPTEDQLP